MPQLYCGLISYAYQLIFKLLYVQLVYVLVFVKMLYESPTIIHKTNVSKLHVF